MSASSCSDSSLPVSASFHCSVCVCLCAHGCRDLDFPCKMHGGRWLLHLDGFQAGNGNGLDFRACRQEGGPAPRLPSSFCPAAIYQERRGGGGDIPHAPPTPLLGWGWLLTWTWNQWVLLLMSTSKSLSFALMCLYCVFFAIGVLGLPSGHLMEQREKANDQACVFLRGYCLSWVNYHHVEICSLSPPQNQRCQASLVSRLELYLDKKDSVPTWHHATEFQSYSGILKKDRMV